MFTMDHDEGGHFSRLRPMTQPPSQQVPLRLPTRMRLLVCTASRKKDGSSCKSSQTNLQSVEEDAVDAPEHRLRKSMSNLEKRLDYLTSEENATCVNSFRLGLQRRRKSNYTQKNLPCSNLQQSDIHSTYHVKKCIDILKVDICAESTTWRLPILQPTREQTKMFITRTKQR